MALIKSVRGFTPVIGENCYLSENAVIIGDVTIGNDCSIWFNAVLRGDVNSITIGNRVNIQDGAVLHTLYQRSVIEVGDQVTIAHNAVVHGVKICDRVLIGIGAVILDHTVIHENSIVAAGAVVLSKTVIEANSVYAGNPAKKIKEVSPEHSRNMIERIARDYKMYAGWYKE
ncbi:MAG: gamma carbonic anhydrase family protein [Bacteroidales bacterium]|jgi:carbonic anhydrase/acetyltransferase-like protein (isoleucine patch superfamily)